MTAKLTDHDREIVAAARELMMLPGIASIREHTGYNNNDQALIAFAGEAKYLLANLVTCVTRLTEDTDG